MMEIHRWYVFCRVLSTGRMAECGGPFNSHAEAMLALQGEEQYRSMEFTIADVVFPSEIRAATQPARAAEQGEE